MYFKDKVIWITGASSGVGEAMATKLSCEGAKIIISARREDELLRIKERANCEKENIFVLPLDLSKHDELIQISEKAWNAFGRIDIVFHNGGISQRSTALETVFEVDKTMMDVNYFGAVIITKCLLPKMIAAGGGRFMVMSSLSGEFGMPLRSAYAASKHALHGFFDSLRAELYDKGISVTIICSGYIKTNIAENALTGKGNKFSEKDPGIEKGMSPELFVKKALKAVRNNKNYLLLGGSEKFGVYLKRFAPGVLSRILRKK